MSNFFKSVGRFLGKAVKTIAPLLIPGGPIAKTLITGLLRNSSRAKQAAKVFESVGLEAPVVSATAATESDAIGTPPSTSAQPTAAGLVNMMPGKLDAPTQASQIRSRRSRRNRA